MKYKRLFFKTFLYFIGNLSSKILTIALIPIYAFSIQPKDLGNYDYALTLMNIIVPIAFLAIWEAILKHVLTIESQEEKKKYINSAFMFSFVATVFLIFLTSIMNRIGFLNFENFILVQVMFIIYAYATILQYTSRALGKNKEYVYSGILSTIFNFIAALGFIYILDYGIYSLYFSYIIGQVSIVCFLGLKTNIFGMFHKKYFDIKYIKEMLCFSTPLVLNIISAWLITGFGRYIITNELGEISNGLYSFATKFSTLITTVGAVVSMAVIEEAIIGNTEEGFQSTFKETMNLVYKVFYSILICILPLIYIIYFSFTNTEYMESINYVAILLLYALFQVIGTNIGSAFQALSKTKYQFITTGIGGVATVIISFAFIESLGIYSVLIGQVIGMAVVMITRYIFIRKMINVKFDLMKVFISMIYFVIISYFFIESNFLILIGLFLVNIIVALYLNKELILQIFNIITRKSAN